ncbi:molybdenum cofactor guanylyltransferase [Virgibacillus alimentarius]|nr:MULTISPECIES: molybdenum cofactor guanylyltransferase [Virgibacillus]HLR66276.1 molybdenum cofactor guanylyltransferase [Virgibacillus sp.]
MEVCGVILSGGKSSRMGTNKSLLEINHKPVIKHILEELQHCSDNVMIVANEPSLYEFLGVKLCSDRYIDKGPLAGLETALYHIDANAYIIAACDMPFISKDIYHFLLNQLDHDDAVVPIYNNHMHPLSGIYTRRALPVIQAHLEKNNLKVKGFFDDIRVNYVSDFGTLPEELLQKHFFNMNSPAEYEKATQV